MFCSLMILLGEADLRQKIERLFNKVVSVARGMQVVCICMQWLGSIVLVLIRAA